MSRIGKLPISVPSGVELTISPENLVTVKGKLGELTQQVNPAVKINCEEGIVTLSIEEETKQNKSYHGLYRVLISNMVKGVSEGFVIEQELIGVGYKVTVEGQVLELALGYSHHIYLQLPDEVKAEATAERGKNPSLKLISCDKQLVGQVAAKIRSLRKPEPYKGKGILYKGEIVRRKAGKTAAS